MNPPSQPIGVRIRKAVRNGVDRFLNGTHHHYFHELPSPCGVVSDMILRLFFSGIRITDTQAAVIRDLPDNAVVLYATKQKSYFEHLFYHNRFHRLKMPVPVIGVGYPIRLWQPFGRTFQIIVARIDALIKNRRCPDPYRDGYFAQCLQDGKAAHLFLVDKRGFYRRFVKAKADPLQLVIGLQRTLDRPVYIVPMMLFFSKSPMRAHPTLVDVIFGTEQRPGVLRRIWSMVLRPEQINVEVSKPYNVQKLLTLDEHQGATDEQLATDLRRRLLLQINRHQQSVTGPTLKSREELKQSILTRDRMQTYMRQYAEKKSVPLMQVRKQADEHLEEIAAKYNVGLIKFFSLAMTWLFNAMFNGVSIDQEGLNRLKRVSQRGPVILIPCHKSHIDYLILSYLLYHNNMPCPLIAAGKNLSFWPMGPIFRGAGAFFIRRSFKGQVLYAKSFSEYIYKLLEEGFNIEFFIEGGRSRTGKLILPKLGLLSILLNAFREGACWDMILAPIYIGYDRVLEDSAYVSELSGEAKKPENLKGVLRARRFLKKRYGRIYIKFHEPLSIRKLLKQQGIQLDALTNADQSALVRNLGHRVINAINAVTVVTAESIVAGSVLNNIKKRISHDHLMFHIETYRTWLDYQEAPMADSILQDGHRAYDQALDIFTQRKFIERISLDAADGTNVVYSVAEHQRTHLEYYKNNSLAFFIPAAFTAAAILEQDSFHISTDALYDRYQFFQDLFKNEFAYDVDRPVSDYVRKTIKGFIDQDILDPHPTTPETYTITSVGLRRLKLFAAFLSTYLESYWIVIQYMRATPKKSSSPKERIKKIESLGAKMYKIEEIERKEALSKINYQNAIDFFISRGIAGAEDIDKMEPYADAIQRYMHLLPR